MRVVVTEYVTLDGVFEEPGNWSLILRSTSSMSSSRATRFFWAE